MSELQAERYHQIVDLFSKQLQAEGKQLIHYEVKTDTIPPGSSFCSGIVALNYTFEDGSTSGSESVLVKIPSEGVLYEVFKALPITIYRNEVLVYTVLLPEMYKLWSGQPFTPKSYLSSNQHNILILQDLRTQGYKPVDRKTQLDLNHSMFALRELAKFHALSVMVHERLPHIGNEIACTDLSKINPEFRSFVDTLFVRTVNTARSLNVSEKVIRNMNAYLKNQLWDLALRTTRECDGFNVFLHGDFHINNILFKQDELGHPVSVMLVDFQVCHRGSPAIDLIYFFVSSVQVDVFLGNEETLLLEYLNTFNGTLRTLKLDCVYELADLRADLVKFKYFYLHILGTAMGVVLSDTTDQDHCGKESPDQIYQSESYQDSLLKWIRYLEGKNVL